MTTKPQPQYKQEQICIVVNSHRPGSGQTSSELSEINIFPSLETDPISAYLFSGSVNSVFLTTTVLHVGVAPNPLPFGNSAHQPVGDLSNISSAPVVASIGQIELTTSSSLDLNLSRWQWRAQTPQMQATLTNIISRFQDDRGTLSAGYSATSIVLERLLDNHSVTDSQLTAIANLTQQNFESAREDPAYIQAHFPNYATLPDHILTVDLYHILTGVPAAFISACWPSLGLTGTPDTLLTYSTDPWLRLGTDVHDLSDGLQELGVAGLNTSLWGVSGKVSSALVMAMEAFAHSTANLIPFADQILNAAGVSNLPIPVLSLAQKIEAAGQVGSAIATKIAIFYGNQNTASQILEQTAAKTLGGWIAANAASQAYGVVGDSLVAKSLYSQLYSNFATTSLNMVQSAISQSIEVALNINNPLAQIGVDAVIRTLTTHAYSVLAVEATDLNYASTYLGVNPFIDLNTSLPSLAGDVLDAAFPSLEGFIGSQLFDALDDAWGGVDLHNQGAAFGAIIGNYLIPGIGTLLGEVVGGWLWQLIDNEHPRAYYSVTFDAVSGVFTHQFVLSRDDGHTDVAEQMSHSAQDTLQSRSSKRSKAKRRDRVRTVGASLHPWGVTGCRYASERGGTTGRSATPSPRTHKPAHHPINDTREASQLSDPSPRRGARQQAQRRPEAERKALGLPIGVKASAEGVSRAWATRVQREGDQARVVPG